MLNNIMKRKAKIGEKELAELKQQIREQGITNQQLADEAQVSLRAVAYFLGGSTYSQPIYNAAIRLLGQRLQVEINTLKTKTDKFVTIL